MRIFILAGTLVMMNASFAVAQGTVDPETLERIHTIATQTVPGKVLETIEDTEDGKHLYEIKVLNKEGSLYEIEIDADTEEVVEVELEKLGEGAELPEPKLKEAEANANARNHVRRNTDGHKNPRVIETEYTLRNGKLVYEVEVKRLFDIYEVIVDAETGSIIHMEKEEPLR